MTLALIVAMSENRVIGREGRLPWRLSADLRRFKRLTLGHHLIMGRKTFESIGRVLPGRTSIVISRRAGYAIPEAAVASSLEAALQWAQGDPEVFVIGGGELYRLALPHAERIYLTLVHAQVEGDTLFPKLRPDDWRVVEATRFPRDGQNEFDHSFLIYERVPHVGTSTSRVTGSDQPAAG